MHTKVEVVVFYSPKHGIYCSLKIHVATQSVKLSTNGKKGIGEGEGGSHAYLHGLSQTIF
jgi:hypothetical protein